MNSKTQKYSTVITVRLTQTQHDHLATRAKDTGRSFTDHIRDLIDQEITGWQRPPQTAAELQTTEIPLRDIEPENFNLDPFDLDNPTVRAITAAQAQPESQSEESLADKLRRNQAQLMADILNAKLPEAIA